MVNHASPNFVVMYIFQHLAKFTRWDAFSFLSHLFDKHSCTLELVTPDWELDSSLQFSDLIQDSTFWLENRFVTWTRLKTCNQRVTWSTSRSNYSCKKTKSLYSSGVHYILIQPITFLFQTTVKLVCTLSLVSVFRLICFKLQWSWFVY